MPQTALASSGPALSGPNPAAGLSAQNAPYLKKITDEAEEAKRFGAESDAKRDQSLSALDAKQAADPEANLKPPTLAPEPVAKSTNALHQWGSTAMTLALLGSLMTRQPLTTALNAAAGVMTAFRKGDQEAATAEFQKWKVANDNYTKLYDYQSKVYERVIGDYRHQHEDILNASNKDKMEKLAELKAYAGAMMDPVLAQTKTLDEAVKYLLGQERAYTANQAAAPRMAEAYYFKQALTAAEKDPNFQRLTPEQKQQHVLGLLHETAPQAHREAEAEANRQFNKHVAQLSKALADIDKDAAANVTQFGKEPAPGSEGDKRARSIVQSRQKVSNALQAVYEQWRVHFGDALELDHQNEAARPAYTQENPAHPKTPEEALNLPPGSYFYNGHGVLTQIPPKG